MQQAGAGQFARGLLQALVGAEVTMSVADEAFPLFEAAAPEIDMVMQLASYPSERQQCGGAHFHTKEHAYSVR
jgi:hypothetical protein